jgi:hypothetical protein
MPELLPIGATEERCTENIKVHKVDLKIETATKCTKLKNTDPKVSRHALHDNLFWVGKLSRSTFFIDSTTGTTKVVSCGAMTVNGLLLYTSSENSHV